jgi:N-acetylmuramoyl-L-alanine amidase
LRFERKRIAVGLAVLAGTLAGALARADGSAAPDRFDTVVIDAGHGGDDEGARGAAGLLEKDLVLDVAQRLAKRLRASGLKIVLTRRDDSFVPL